MNVVSHQQIAAIDNDADTALPVHDGSAVGRLVSWFERHTPVLTVAAVCVTPILYLIFILHFTSDGLLFDDWRMVPFLHSALHGHFSWGQLWSQYGEPRLPLVRLDLLIFAKATQLDTRWSILFSAAVLIASYGLLLKLFRKYLGRRLTPIPVLIIGALWFSLADTQSALLAFEVGWYLVVFGFIGMLFSLLIPQRGRNGWLLVAMVAAVIATFGAIQGFVVWPIGAVAIFWCQPKSRRMLVELGAWIGSFLITVAIYLVGYNFSLTSCYPDFGCRPTSVLAHPFSAVRFFVVLIGNVIPGSFTSNQPGTYLGQPPASVLRFEIVGALLLAVSVVIIFRSIRDRSTREPLPLPLLLIGLSFLFDATIVWGRLGEGASGSVISNRYVMPNIVLLTAIMMYVFAHMPPLRLPASGGGWTSVATRISLLVLAVLVVLQIMVATTVGLTAGRDTQAFVVDGARVAVNLDSIPSGYRDCELTHYLIPPSDVSDASVDHLGEFAPGVEAHYRSLGVPPLLLACTEPLASHAKA